MKTSIKRVGGRLFRLILRESITFNFKKEKLKYNNRKSRVKFYLFLQLVPKKCGKETRTVNSFASLRRIHVNAKTKYLLDIVKVIDFAFTYDDPLQKILE